MDDLVIFVAFVSGRYKHTSPICLEFRMIGQQSSLIDCSSFRPLEYDIVGTESPPRFFFLFMMKESPPRFVSQKSKTKSPKTPRVVL